IRATRRATRAQPADAHTTHAKVGLIPILVYPNASRSLAPADLMPLLLGLMGGSGRAVPQWLVAECGRLLTQTVMRPGGVLAILTQLVCSDGTNFFSAPRKIRI